MRNALREKDRVICVIHCTTFVGKLRKGLFSAILHELFHARWFLKMSSPLPQCNKPY